MWLESKGIHSRSPGLLHNFYFNASRWHFRRRVVDHEPVPCWWQQVVTHQVLSRRSLQLQRVKPGAAVWAAENAMSSWGALGS